MTEGMSSSSSSVPIYWGVPCVTHDISSGASSSNGNDVNNATASFRTAMGIQDHVPVSAYKLVPINADAPIQQDDKIVFALPDSKFDCRSIETLIDRVKTAESQLEKFKKLIQVIVQPWIYPSKCSNRTVSDVNFEFIIENV